MPVTRVFDREENTSTVEDFSSSNPQQGTYWFEDEMMEITFWNGRMYRYYGIPKNVWKGLCDADRPGRYFYYNIRGAGRHPVSLYAYEEI